MNSTPTMTISDGSVGSVNPSPRQVTRALQEGLGEGDRKVHGKAKSVWVQMEGASTLERLSKENLGSVAVSPMGPSRMLLVE